MTSNVNQEDDTNTGCGLNTSALAFEENRLSYVGQECRLIPVELHRLYGSRTRCLDLSYNSLVSLQGLRNFPQLEELVLDNNSLTDNLHLPQLPLLHTLSLNKNNVRNLEVLLTQVTRSLPTLTYLSLLGNPACPDQLSDAESDDRDYQAYRMYVIHRIPSLRFLDFTAISNVERIEAQRRGQLMKVVRPNHQPAVAEVDACDPTSLYSPLPISRRENGHHIGAYSRCQYRYSGKHSEGNRFIQNSDL